MTMNICCYWLPIERLRETMGEACLPRWADPGLVYLYPLDLVQIEAHLTPFKGCEMGISSHRANCSKQAG